MKKIALVLLSCFVILTSNAQTKSLSTDPTKWTIEEMKRFAALPPAEQEALKKKMLQQAEGQLKQKADAANITIDETLLPTTGLQPPVLDAKRIAMIPAAPPTRQQMIQQVAKMEAALKTTLAPQELQSVEQFAASKSIKEIQSASIGGWFSSNPQAALLLGMKATAKDPADIPAWNNLAALLNLSGMEQHAVPILQNCLQQKPNNPTLLNNMGQAWLGLGDLTRSKQFLQQCLSLDELHPEANRSMAMIYLFGNDMENALKHFEKEMQVANRRSSLAQLVKSGQRSRINLAALRKQKQQHDGTNNRDFFSEIALGKFKIPNAPENSFATKAWNAEHEGLRQSINEEMLFWMNASQASAEQLRTEGKLYPSVYHDLVNELISDLGDQYIPLLSIINEDDVVHLQNLHNTYAERDRQLNCPEPPNEPGMAAVNFPAYAKQCCDLKTPLIDALMTEYNSFITARISAAQSNYKQYINGLINIVQLDPSPANRRLVYAAVGGYFSFLQTAIGSYLVLDPYMTCKPGMSSEEAMEIISSTRNIDLKCPSWLKIKVSLGVAKLSADCNGYNIEADVYKLIQVGAEKKFKTGTSTLYVGAGIEGSFKGVASGSIKQQFYIVFDHNNDFADLGMRGGASGNIGGGAIGAEFGYDFSMNSGFNAQGKVESKWISNWEKAMTYVGK